MPQVLYDVCREAAPIAGGVRGGAAGALLGLILLAIVWRRRDTGMRVFAVLWTVVWAALSGVTALTTIRRHHAACELLSSGQAAVVQGEVLDFQRASLDGRKPESFSVGGRPFKLSPSQSHAGLNRPSSHGGPVKSGDVLRITYTGPSILRVERLARPAGGGSGDQAQ